MGREPRGHREAEAAGAAQHDRRCSRKIERTNVVAGVIGGRHDRIVRELFGGCSDTMSGALGACLLTEEIWK